MKTTSFIIKAPRHFNTMKPLAMRTLILVFLALVAAVTSGPISLDDNTCATTCTESSKFQYSVGQKYSFAYEADTVTSLQGASEEHSSLHIRANAHFSVLSPCEFMLVLRDVTLEQSDPRDLSIRKISENSREFQRALEAAPLKFSYQDGKVEHVCADAEDSTWVVNMKRGVLSAFQNTMDSLTENHKGSETDVAGVCDAEYKVTKKSWGGKTTITKNKDLAACSDRHGHFSAIQATPYKLGSDMRSMPLMSGSHQCEQTIGSNGILERSECSEEHIFRPFSNHKSGASTTARQLLTFSSQSAKDNVRIGSTRRTSLLFEHEDTTPNQQDDSEVMAVLHEICELEDVRPETPRLYSRLVYAMRKVDANTMKNLHRQVEAGSICSKNKHMSKKFFHDAIPSVSTASSASLMRELIQNNEVSTQDADTWLTSLAFIAQPSSDMIREIAPLLQGTPSRKTYLSISTLVHSYCRQSEDCESNQDVEQVLTAITNNLGYNCRDSDNEKLIMSLKALGNTGRAPRAVPVLSRCLANTELPMDVRVAAVEAFRRMPCGNRDDVMTILLNAEEDSEIRIHAYLAAMQCPTESAIFQIKEMLANEPVNQVASFVWTHLTNLKETDDIFKQAIREILEDEKLQKEFDLDARKFSRNYEGSMFFDSLNAGAKVESNVIWSPKSFVPRSAMFNLTVDLFGQSVNFVELGGRVEGAEDFLQKMFGPDGYFPTEARSKRSVSTDDQLKQLNRADPKAAMYLKMFGNELRYWDLSDFHKVEGEDFNVLDLLIKLAAEHEVEWSKSSMFLDSELSIPTVLGLPLKLTVNGTATIDVKMGGKMDLRQIAAYPNSMDINGYVKPSGAIEVSSVMGLDAFVARTGLKMVSTLHTSTEVEGLIKLDESKALSVKFNMPKDKIEILNVKTQFFIMHREEEREQQMLTDNIKVVGKCSGKSMEQALGLKLCSELSYPATSKDDAPMFPFTGPISGSVVLTKVDDHKSYEFDARFETTKEGKMAKTHVARLAFNTPGSRVDREILAEVVIDRADMKVSANLKTPWKQATVDGALINGVELKSARFDMTMDKKPFLNLLSELQIDARPKATKYSPNVAVNVYGKPVLTLKGDTKYVAGDKIDTDMTLECSLLSSPIVLKGGIDADLKKSKDRWNTDILFQSPIFNTKVAGFTQRKGDVLSSRMEFRYDYNDASTHRFIFNSKLRDQSNAKATKYSVNTAITTTEFPDYNVEIDADYMHNQKHVETSLDMRYGQDAKDPKKRIVFSQELDFVGNKKDMKIDHIAKLKWKAMELDMQSKVSHRHSLYDSLKTQASFSYAPNKEVSLDASLKKDTSDLMIITGDVVLSMPGREMRFYKSIEQKSAHVFNHEMIAQWQKGGQVRTTAIYSRVPAEKRHEVRAEIYGPVGEPTVLSANAILKMDDFSGKMQVEHRRNIYSTEVKYNYMLAKLNKAINANFDLVYPSRHITAEGAFTCDERDHVLSLKTMWDADNDKSQKFVLSGRLNQVPTSHEGQLKMSVPGRTITMAVSNKLENGDFSSHTDFSWAPQKTMALDASGSFAYTTYAQKLQGKIGFTSPFPNAEELMLNVEHKFNKRILNNKIDFTYAPGKTFSSDLSTDINNGFLDIDSKWKGSTPIPGFEMLASNVKYSIQGANVQSQATLSLNRQSVSLNIDNSYKSQQLITKVSTQTTFIAVRDAEVQLGYSFNAESANANFVAVHNGAEKFGLISSAKYGAEMEAQIQVRIPEMEEISAQMNAKTAQNPMTGHAEFKWAQDKVIALDGELNTGASLNNIDGQLKLTTPFSSAENIVINHQHTYTRTLRSKTDVEYAPGQKIVLATSFSNAQELAMSMKLATPFAAVRSLSGDFSFSGRGLSFDTKSSMDFRGRYASITYDNTFAMRGLTYMVGNTKMNTPSTGSIEINLDHQKPAEEQVSKFDVSFEPNQKISVETHYQYESQIVYSLDLTTTFPQVPSMSMRMSHQGYGSNFVNKASFNSQIMRQPITFESDISLRGMNTGNVALKLTTPFENMKTLGLTITHSYAGNNLECHSEIQIDERRTITFDHKMGFASGLTLNTEIKTPFRSFRALSLDLQHSGPISRFNNKVSVNVVTSYGPIKYDSSLRMGGIRSINGQMILTTPFNQVDNVEMNINHGLNGESWTTTFDIASHPNLPKSEFESKINMNNVDISLKTPFTDTPIVFSASQKINSGKWVGETSLSYASKRIEAVLGYENTNAIKASAKINTPYASFQSLDAYFEHSGPWNNFNTQITGSLNKQEIDIEAAFNFDFKNLEAKINMNTPFTRKMAAAVSHQEQGFRTYASSASGSYGPQEISVSSNINLRELTEMSIGASVNTPFTEARQLVFTAAHNGELSNFNNKVEFQRNDEKTTYEGSFKANRAAFIGDFKFVSPYSVDFVQLKFNCAKDGAKNNIEVSYASNKKIEFQSTYDVSNGFQFTSDFTAPFIKPVSVNINQVGMSVEAQASMGPQRITLSSQARIDPVSAKVVFTSPFSAVRRIEWTMNGNGDIGAFNVETSFIHNSRNNLNLKADFYNRENIKAKFDWTSSFENIEEITLEFAHTGDYSAFETTAMLSYAPGKKIATEMKLTTSPSIEGHFKLNTPFQAIEDLELNIAHSGSIQSFQCNGDLTYNNNKIVNGELTFSNERAIQGSMKLKAPFTNLVADFSHKSRRNMNSEANIDFNGYIVKFSQELKTSPIDYTLKLQTPCPYMKDVSVSLKHEGNSNQFMNTFEFNHERYGKVSTDAKFQMTPLDVSLAVQTPSEYLRDASVTIKHDGDLSHFTNEAQFNHERLGQVTFSSNFDANPIKFNAELKTPVSMIRSAQISFDHTNQARGFLTNAALALNGKDYKISADIKSYPESSIKIETPFSEVRDLALNLKSNNNLRDFDGSISLVKNGQSYISAEANLNTIRKVEGSFKLNTMFEVLRSLEASVKHEGDITHFSNNAELSYNGQRMFHGESEFSLSPLKGSIAIETPITNASNLKAAFSHSGSLTQFRTHAEFTHNTNNQFMADVAFQSYPGIECTVQLSTPFQIMESVSLKINHQGDLRAFQSNAEMTLNSRNKYGAQAQFSVDPHVEGKLNVATPISGYRNINAAVKFIGNKEAFETSAELSADKKSFNVDASFQARPLEAKINVKTPFENYNELSAEIAHKGNLMKAFQSRAAMNYQDGKQMEINAEFKNYNKMIATVGIKTPFIGYEDMSMNMRHNTDGSSIDSSAEVNYGQKRSVSADVSLTLSPNMEGKVAINTPFRGFKKMELSFNHQMTSSSINSNAQFTYGRDVTSAVVNANYPSLNDLTGSLDINTPFYGYENMKMSASHLTYPTVKCSMAMSLNNKEIRGAFNLDKSNGIESSLAINTPFRNYEEMMATVSHTGNLRRFTSKVTITGAMPFEATADVNTLNEVSAVFKVNCPCPYIGQAGAEFKIQGDKENFRTNGKLYKESSIIAMTGSYASSNGIPSQVNFELTNPMTDKISLVVSNDYQRNGQFSSNAALSWSERQRIEVRATGTLNGHIKDLLLNADVTISTPFRSFQEMKIKTEHQHDTSSFNTKANIDFNRQKMVDAEMQYGQANSNVVMRVPYPVSAKINSNGDMKDLTSTMEVNWDTTQRDSNIRLEITNKDQSTSSGIQRDISVKTITARRTMSLVTSLMKNTNTFTHNAAFSWDEARDKTVSYKINYNDQSRRYNHLYTLEASLETPVRSAQLTMNHNDDSQTYNTEASLLWDSARDQSKKITISNKYALNGNTHNNELKINHPAMERDLVIRNDFILNDNKVLFNGNMEVEATSSPLKLSALLEDKAQESGAFDYTLTLGVSHPRTTLDMTIIADIANTRQVMKSGLVLNYMTAKRDNKMMALRADIDKLQKTLKVELDTPMKKAELTGDMSAISSGTAYTLAAKSEGQAVTARLEVQPINNAFDLKTYYSPDNQANVMHVSGHYLSATSMQFEAYRMHNGDKVSESTLNVDLENGHLLKTSIYWRPEMITELKAQAQVASRTIAHETSELYNEASTAIIRETRRKAQLFSFPDFSSFIEYNQAELRSWSQDAQTVKNAFNQMYYRNEFFLKSMDETKDAMISAMWTGFMVVADACDRAVAAVQANIDQVLFQMRYMGFRMLALANRYAEDIIDMMYHGVDFANAQYQAGKQIAIAIAKKVWVMIEAKWAIYGEEITNKVLAVAEKVTIATKPIINAAYNAYIQSKRSLYRTSLVIADKYNTLVAKLPLTYLSNKLSEASARLSQPMNDVQISVRNNVKGFVNTFNNRVMRFTRQASKQVAEAMEAINVKLTEFLEHDDSKYAHAFVQEVYKQGKALYSYLDLENNVRDLVKDSAAGLVKLVRRNSLYVVDDYLNLEQDKLIKYNPAKGELEFQIWLPMDVPSLQGLTMPDFEVLREMSVKLVEFVKNLIPQDFSPYDYYYTYKPSDMTNMIPPFNTYALLSGNQHYLTWDKRYFEFAGSCSYTLARDFVDQTFEVLVNYEDQREVTRKSLSVRTENQDVEIMSNGKVTLNGQETELPLSFESVSMVRDGNMVHLHSDKGFTVSCDVTNDVCMLNISGWYHNKVAGLLGTYTNEKSDDFMMADGSKAASVEDFTKSWAAGKCRAIENRARVWQSPSQVCDKLFNNQYSSFRRCYKVVDPTPYISMCTNDVTDDVTNGGEERSACKAAAMYVMHCKKEGVSVRLPRACVACDKPSYDQYFEGQELTAYAAEQSTDVIFVIEEKPCNQEAINKLGDLSTNIDIALKAKGLSNNQFGLIGFGGDNLHNDEHTHTVGGQILGSAQDFMKAVANLQFTKEGENTDVFKSLRMAAKYPFRAGVAKSIVLLTCSECTEQNARYNEIQHNLLERGISLHVIMDHEFVLGGEISTPKTNYLFGIDKETAYTARHVSDKKLEGDAELFTQVIKPTTMCAKLAQETDGSFFNFNKMTAGRVRFQKHFIDVFSRRVAKSAEVPQCQVCECVSDSNGAGRSVCKPCEATVDRLDERVLGYKVEPQQLYQANPEFNLDFEES